MRAPRLTRKLVLEAPIQVADGGGGFGETWSVVGTLWAEMNARTGREALDGAVSVSRVIYRIVVRAAPSGAPSRPSPGQRFRDGARIYLIQAVADRDLEGRFLTCFAKEETAA